MRREFVATLALLTGMALWGRELPPMPDPSEAEAKRQILERCRVPAQIVVLPPMVEPDYRSCVNEYYKPIDRVAKERISALLGQEVEIVRLEIAKGFIRTYEVEISLSGQKQGPVWSKQSPADPKKLQLVCNEFLDRCFEVDRVYQKPEQKDKK